MIHLLKVLAQTWHLSPAQYWHLRIVSAVSLVPLLAVLYLLLTFVVRNLRALRQASRRLPLPRTLGNPLGPITGSKLARAPHTGA